MSTKIFFPLSHPQKRIWYVEQIFPGTSLYNIGGTVRITGSLAVTLLEKAILLFLENNSGTRLRITIKDEQPYQYISAIHENSNIYHLDFSNYSHPYNVFKDWVKSEAQMPFTLLDNSLFKIYIFKLTEHEAGYFLKFHHIICDGFSFYLMTSQIMMNYKMLKNQKPIHGDIQYNYTDYIETETQYLDSERFQKNRLYWLDKFKDLDILPATKSGNNIKGCRRDFIINSGQTAHIRKFISKKNISLNTFYTGILLIYLYKMLGKKNHILGIPVLNRFGRKERNTFGMYTSTMPFRTGMDENLTVHDFFVKIDKELGLCYLNQKYPYNLLAHELELRKRGFDALFDIFINYYNMKHITVSDESKIVNEDFYSGYQIYSLQLIIREWLDNDEILLSYDYKIDDYTEKDIINLHEFLIIIINQVLNDESMPVHAIELLTEEKKQQLLYAFNATKKEYPIDKPIHVLFEEQAKITPDNIAVSYDNYSVTYQELNNRANQLALRIQKEEGSCCGSIIPITGIHSIELIIGILAILKAGCVFLPVDPEIPDERLQLIIGETSAKLMLNSGNKRLKKFSKLNIMDIDNPEFYTGCANNIPGLISPGELAYIIYTSGSTGKPKGVMVSHNNLVNYIYWAKNQYINGAHDIFAFYSSIAFDLTLTSIFTPLISGAQIRIYNPSETDKDFVLYRILEENKATIVKLTPSHLKLINDRDNSHSGIKRFIIGGENLKVQLAKEIYKSFNGHIELYNEYGPTEATVGCMIHRYDYENDRGLSVPIGRPAANCQIFVLDKALKPVPEGSCGEIFISGDCVSCGYYHNEQLTGECFIANPFFPGRQMYKTGDLALFADKECIIYIGRVDSQIKIRGNRVELGEIERHILSVGGVDDVIVMKKQNNDVSEYLCAYIKTGKAIDEAYLGNYLSEILPAYMVPSVYFFMESFPLTANGKIDKKQLPDAQVLRTSEIGSNVHCDSNSRLIMSVIKEILCLDKIDLLDNYYHLGGESIKAIQISSRLKKIGFKLSVNDILGHPVLSQMIQHAVSIEYENTVAQTFCSGEVENTPVVSWFFENNFKNPHYYNQSVLLRLKFFPKIDELTAILEFIVRHYDTLRLNYNGNTKKLFYNNDYLTGSINIKKIDLKSYGEAEQSMKIKEECIAAKSAFNIEESLLISCILFQIDADNNYLFITSHHLVMDGVSWRILLDAMKILIEQSLIGQELALPLKTNSYRDWVGYLYSNTLYRILEKEIGYWNAIADCNFIFPRSINVDYGKGFNTIIDSLSEHETDILVSGANIPYNTKTDELLIIAIALMLNDITRDEAIMLELESHGRHELLTGIDVSSTIGWFTALYPIRFVITGKDLNSRIKSLKDQIQTVPNKGFGYGILKYHYHKIKPLQGPIIRFNFLGDFSQYSNNYFEISTMEHGFEIDSENHLRCPLEINTMILDRKLFILMNHNRAYFSEEEISGLLHDYKNKIRDIVTHCTEKKECEFTPQDFNTVNLSQNELDGLFI